MTQLSVPADPYGWPCTGPIAPERVALMVIDMQVDFCGVGGYIDSQGIDIGPARETIPRIRALLDCVRDIPGMRVIHTREGHRPELVDLPRNKRLRSEAVSPGIGSPGPCGRLLVRGEPGWEIVPELEPAPGEIVVDKPGKGSFFATDLDHVLRTCGVDHLILTGLTTDVCVHTTLREANDRGLECLLLSDCTMATERRHYEASLTMTVMQGGLFGAVSDSATAISAFKRLPQAI